MITLDEIELTRANTVIDLGCGTGRNFSYLQEKICRNGHLTGVDLTKEMLEEARMQVVHLGWANVELMHADASRSNVPIDVDGILSTSMLSTMPEHENIIERAAESHRPSGMAAGDKWSVPQAAVAQKREGKA